MEQRTDARGPGSSMPGASIRISAQFSVQVTQVGIVDVERWPSGDAVCQCVSGLEMTQRRPGVCASGLLQQVNKRAMDGVNGRSGQVQKRYMYIPYLPGTLDGLGSFSPCEVARRASPRPRNGSQSISAIPPTS